MDKDDDSPSFSTYSGDRIAEIAERVGRKFAEDDEFEFAILEAAPSSSHGVGLVFPVFNQNLVFKNSAVETNGVLTETVITPLKDLQTTSLSSAVETKGDLTEAVITPLKDLFLRERNDEPPQQTYSSSSDDDEEDEELDTISSEIYCPWTPARSTAEMSPSGGCRKSKSTGSSSTKRWRIRDLLKRSHSDGKQSLKFLNPNSINKNLIANETESLKNKEIVMKNKKKEKVSAHEKFYLKNKAMKEEDKRKSYLPYKQDLVGLFSNINRFGKTFPPF